MKATMIRSFVFASAALVLGAAAYAQSAGQLVADVSFNFRSSMADLPAGKYTVSVSRGTGNSIYQIRNVATGHSVFLGAGYMLSPKASARPSLAFNCDSTACALAEIWMGAGEPGLSRSEAPPESR